MYFAKVYAVLLILKMSSLQISDEFSVTTTSVLEIDSNTINATNTSIYSHEFYNYSAFDMSFQEMDRQTNENILKAVEDLPNIINAMKFFKDLSASRLPIECSDFVPTYLIEALKAPPNKHPITGQYENIAQESLTYDSNIFDHKRRPYIDDNTKRLLTKSYYAKTLRPVVMNCIHQMHKKMNISRETPPLSNPFSPLKLSISFGANKLVSLSFDGSMALKATLSLKWNDPNWNWNSTTRCGMNFYLRFYII